MLRFLFLCLLLGALALSANAQQATYWQVPAQKGDGVIKLLSRYRLEHNQANIDEFYRINQLKKNAGLVAERLYKLPVLQYAYNGKSIRSTLAIENLRQAKQVEDYNLFLQESGLRSDNFRSSGAALYAPFHILHPEKSGFVPEQLVPKNRDFPIFGKSYQNVPLQDQQLAGAVYYIISGHGGPDSGARGTFRGQTICEDEYAYDIALRLARNLLERGALVYVIVRDTSNGIRDEELLRCDFGEFCYPNEFIPVSQKERLTQRTDVINQLYKEHRKQGVEYQRVIELHIDSRSLQQRLDVFFYHYPGSLRGRALAQTLHRVFGEKYAKHRPKGDYSGTISERDLHTLRESLPPSVFIELGNIQNPNDQKRFVLPDNRQALANWLAQALLSDY